MATGHPSEKELVTPPWMAAFREEFPGWGWALDVADSSLLVILDEWWNETGMDSEIAYEDKYDTLLAGLKNSDWFRTNIQSVRDSIIQEGEDPATFKHNIEVNVADARDYAHGLGIVLDPEELEEIGYAAERFDWDKTQITHHIINIAYQTGRTLGRGEIQRTYDSLQNFAGAQYVDMSDQQLKDYAFRINQGEDTLEAAEGFINAKAQAQWGFFDVTAAAERGLTVEDMLSPVRHSIAETLEMDPMAVDLKNFGDDLVKGEGDNQRFINAKEGVAWAKQQEAYKGTEEFRSGVTNVAGAIARAFGRR